VWVTWREGDGEEKERLGREGKGKRMRKEQREKERERVRERGGRAGGSEGVL